MRGGRFGNAFLRITSKYVGLRATYFCLYFIVPYFFLFAPNARRASRQYWHTVQPDKSIPTHIWSTTRHFFMFGKILLDRLFETQKQNDFFRVDVRGMQPIRNLLEENQGVIMLTAHIGGWALSVEALAKLAKNDKVVVSELAKGNDHRHLVNTYKQIIDPSQAGLPIFEYKRLLSSGQIVAMMGDRPMTDKLELVKFFGKLAAFDCTPYRIAAACGAPIVTTFAFKESMDEYVLYVSEPKYLVYDPDIPREETVRGWVQSFAAELETYLTKYPEQWSNFYPFFSSLPKAPLPAVANHKGT
jgi:predicted LPLAT superfamily acyltransferase